MKPLLDYSLFFSMTRDYLRVYLPSQHQDSPKTEKAYEDGLTIFRRYLTDVLGISISVFKFSDITYDFLLDYRIYLENQNYKPNTVNHRLAVIMSYLRYAASRKVELTQIYLKVLEVPYVTVPQRIREIIEDKNALRSLLAAPSPSKKGIRDQIILVILYDTAIRAEELINLNLSDINITAEEPFVRIRGKGDKERLVPLSDNTVPLIKQYISIYHSKQNDRSVPFIYTVIKGSVYRMSERNVERIVQKYADMVRPEYPSLPKKVYPHMLRRTRLTGWYRSGIELETVAVLAGHSDIKTTRKSYTVPSVEMLRNKTNNKDEEVNVNSNCEVQPIWKDDNELATLCGVR